MEAGNPKELTWVASSLDDLRDFPDAVRQVMGVALFQAQLGGKHIQAKPLKGFKGGGVFEVVEGFSTAARIARWYTVRHADAVYVLYAFQKKSKKGIQTPKHEMDVVRSRLRMAEELHKAKTSRKKGKRP